MSSTCMENLSKTGYLLKRGGFMKKWHKRFCVLEGDILHTYKHDGDATPRHSIYMNGCQVQTMHKKDFSGIIFSINHPDSSSNAIILSSKDEAIGREWI